MFRPCTLHSSWLTIWSEPVSSPDGVELTLTSPLVPGRRSGRSQLTRYRVEASHRRPPGGSPRDPHRAVPVEIELLEVVPDGVHEGLELLLGVEVRDEVVEVRLRRGLGGSGEGVLGQLRRRRRRTGCWSGDWSGERVGEACDRVLRRRVVVYGGGLVLLLERRVDVAVAHNVAGAACGHLVDVHVEAALLVPGQQAVVVVHLGALGLVMVTHITAASSWLSENENSN